MEKLILIIAALASLGSLLTSGIYAYVALQKLKEPPRDEAWEAALRLICSGNANYGSADEFVDLYHELLLFSEVHGKKRENIIGSLQDEIDHLRKICEEKQHSESVDK